MRSLEVMSPPSHQQQPGGKPETLGAAGAQQPRAQQRRELRVIVGRGTHSAGGEASLPRAVEAFLADQGYRCHWRAGALDVQLRRRWEAASGGGAAAHS